MKRTKKIACFTSLLFLLAGIVSSQAAEERPLIQMAILLDTSGSMSGLIDQAKTQLWKIVNELIMASKEGKKPELRVALFQYGSSALPAEDGYMRMVLPLTDDLDKMSQELFALKIGGSEEYCGTVIERAVDDLGWEESDDHLMTIFIAGNESFAQGRVDYRKACGAAIAKGIVVNTIFCGNHAEGVSTGWKDGALLADGRYMNIDQNREIVAVESPQDEEIARLGRELNDTYIPYGPQGKTGQGNQAAQDLNAASAAKMSFVQRQVTKASSFYNNAGWDLADALKEGRIKLEDLKVEDLPKEMQNMSLEERQAHVESMAEKRRQIQKKILTLNEERKKYVAQEMKKLVETGVDTLDAALINVVRDQAAKKNFKVE